MPYKLAADIIVLAHFLWIIFLLLGALWGVKNKAARIFHLSGLAFAILIQILGWYCPLTYLEVWLRSRHDIALAYTGSFIIHYVEAVVYVELPRTLILFFTLFLCGLNAWIYLRKRKGFQISAERGGFMLTPDQIVTLFNLKPHPEEGGYFVETYRSSEIIPEKALPSRYKGVRFFGTAIYYLLTPETFSMMHRLRSDEIFHFYVGDPVEMLHLQPNGSGEVITMGSDILHGMRPQVVVPKGVWQGARLSKGGRFALLGTTVSPGFEFADYEPGRRDELVKSHPKFRGLIVALTKDSNP